MELNVIKSVAVRDSFAAFLERDGRFGVAQETGDDVKLCFYDSQDLAEEVFDVIAQEVLQNGKN